MIKNFDKNNKNRKLFWIYKVKLNLRNISVFSEIFYKNKKSVMFLRGRYRIKIFSSNSKDNFIRQEYDRKALLVHKLGVIKRIKRKTKV